MIVRQFLHWVRTAFAGVRAEATGALFNRSCFNFPTRGDLYKIATYNAYQKREQTQTPVAPQAAGA